MFTMHTFNMANIVKVGTTVSNSFLVYLDIAILCVQDGIWPQPNPPNPIAKQGGRDQIGVGQISTSLYQALYQVEA